MGHKVNPKAFRLGMTTTWPSRWFARRKNYRDNIEQDHEIRAFFKRELKDAAINAILIDRSRGTLNVTLTTAKPGMVIGHSGAGIEDLKKKFLKEFFRGKKIQFQLNVSEVSKPNLESNLVVQQVIAELEKRMPFRRVLKQSIERVKKAGALGIKIAVSGRLNGAEIARREQLAWGKIPLANLRADVDYAQDFAHTMMGAIGVKVWIYRGDVFAKDRLQQYQPTTPRTPGSPEGHRPPRRERPPMRTRS
ncbi:MAG: 30S ribosomal protein S3 [Patescibacteria group bacterium]|nr:30S ribosomal protein S3 [Patescibacteria group bacterium]